MNFPRLASGNIASRFCPGRKCKVTWTILTRARPRQPKSILILEEEQPVSQRRPNILSGFPVKLERIWAAAGWKKTIRLETKEWISKAANLFGEFRIIPVAPTTMLAAATKNI